MQIQDKDKFKGSYFNVYRKKRVYPGSLRRFGFECGTENVI